MTKVTQRKYNKEYAVVLLRIAEGDLKTVNILTEAIHEGRPENILFIAQQSIEKSLKSVLVHLGISFPLIHDLGILITLIPENYAPPYGYDLRELNQYATTRRYEDGHYKLTDEEIMAAVHGAKMVLSWAQKNILVDT